MNRYFNLDLYWHHQRLPLMVIMLQFWVLLDMRYTDLWIYPLFLFLVNSIILTARCFSSISTTGLGIGNCLNDITIVDILFICNDAIITCI